MKPTDTKQLEALRDVGVKSVKIHGEEVTEVEFYPITGEELMWKTSLTMTSEERAQLNLMDKEDRSKYIEERREKALYHSA